MSRSSSGLTVSLPVPLLVLPAVVAGGLLAVIARRRGATIARSTVDSLPRRIVRPMP